MKAHEKFSTARNTFAFKDRNDDHQAGEQSSPHKLPARTPSTKTTRRKEYVQAAEINTNTAYKTWLPKGWPNCSSRENKMFLLENLKENPLRGRQSTNVVIG